MHLESLIRSRFVPCTGDSTITLESRILTVKGVSSCLSLLLQPYVGLVSLEQTDEINLTTRPSADATKPRSVSMHLKQTGLADSERFIFNDT